MRAIAHTILLSLLVLLAAPVAAADQSAAAYPSSPVVGAICAAPATPAAVPGDAASITAVACCRVCRKGKACGNSCISRAKTCHKGPGCACNGYAPPRPEQEASL